MIDRFEQLEVWQVAHELVLAVYGLTRSFPKDERFGLTSQVRRAALGIPTNVAEGGARGHRREYLQFCYVARGSTAELRYLLQVSRDMGIVSSGDWERLNATTVRVAQMTNALIRALRRPSRHEARSPRPEAR